MQKAIRFVEGAMPLASPPGSVSSRGPPPSSPFSLADVAGLTIGEAEVPW